MLPQVKQQQNFPLSTIKSKGERQPPFIKGELQAYYDQTDLQFLYVYECCKILKPLKGIDINIQQVEFWYKEFIRMGWQKHNFDNQIEAVKRAKLFNRIDLNDWLQTEIMYNEIDLEREITRRIDNMISRGRAAKQIIDSGKIPYSAEEKRLAEITAANQINFELQRERSILLDQLKEIEIQKKREQIRIKKEKLLALSEKEKVKVIKQLYDKGILIGEQSGPEFYATVKHIEFFADLIEI